MENWIALALALAAGVVVFLILRDVVLWYFKIRVMADHLEAQTELLKQIRDRLP